MIKVGCIGCGNMGAGVLKGLLSHKDCLLFGHDHTKSKVESIKNETNCVQWCDTATSLAKECDIIFMAVKPYQIVSVLQDISPVLDSGKIIISMAAGTPIDVIKKSIDALCPVVRIMPNLPVIVGKGVFALCFDDPSLNEEQKICIRQLLDSLGQLVVLPEDKFSAFSALAGCGPAFVLNFMEGFLNAAIAMGIKSSEAKKIIAATFEGTAALSLYQEESFADTRIKVCSPAGTTIQGINHLSRCAVVGNITDAVLASYNRDLEIAKKG